MTQGSAPQRPAPDDLQPGRFIGRQRELAELEAALSGLGESGGRLFLLQGDPGIGKTRLASQLAAKAGAAGAVAVWGRCSEEGGAPAYWPWMQVLRRLQAVPSLRDVVAPTPADAERLAPLTPELAAAGVSVPTHEPAAARFALFDAVAGCLRRVAGKQPLMLVFDDLHAADQPSLLMLKFVAAEIRDLPILLIGTYRRIEVERQPELAAVIADIGRSGKPLPLSGLSRAEAAQLAADVCTAALPDTLVEDIWQRTDGSPFFVDEIARALSAQGVDHLPAHLPENSFRLSLGVRETLRVRLQMLSASTRELLHIAAVFGREFDAVVLEKIAAGIPAVLQENLAEAVAAGLIAAAPPSPTRFSFTHALLREALEADCDRALAAEWHRAVARWLERTAAAPGDDCAAEIARHYFAAGRAADLERAVEYACRAGAAASRRLAYEEAERHYRSALQFVEAQTPCDRLRRCELTLAVAEMQHACSDPATAETLERTSRQARDLIGGGEARGAEFLARAALKKSERGLGIPQLTTDPGVVGALREGLEAVGGGDSPLRARLLGRLAVELAHSESADRCEALSREAVDMAHRLGDPSTLGVTLSCRQFVCWRIGHILDRPATSTEILELGISTGDKELELQGRTWRLVDLLALAEVGSFDKEIEAQMQAAEALRQPRYVWMAACMRGARSLWRADWQEALSWAAKAMKVGARTGDPQAVTSPGILNFLVRRERGELAGEEMRIRQLAEAMPGTPVPRTLLALTLMDLDRRDEAREQFERLAAENFENLRRERRVGVLPFLCELALYLDDAPRAALLEPLVRPHEGTTLPYGTVANFGFADLYIALLEQVLGRDAEAAVHFEKAIAAHERTSAPALLARSRFGYARFLATRPRSGQGAEAEALARQAASAAGALGMTRLASQCVPLLDGLRKAGATEVEVKRQELRATGTGPLAAAEPVRAKLRILPPPRRREPEIVDAAEDHQATFRRDGECWSVGNKTRTIRMKDSKGLAYIARLLAEPGREFHVSELVTLVEPPPPATTEARRAVRDRFSESGFHELRFMSEVGPGAPLDAQAKAAYRTRLGDLREELAEAEQFNDIERASRLRAEIEFLAGELARAVGLGGRDRPTGSEAEKARVNVTRAIKTAIERLKRQHQTLGIYLETTVRTGAFCVYRPDPRFRLEWSL